MLFLILAIIGNSLISIVMRLSEGKVRGRTCMLAVNYLTCMLLAACHTGFGQLFPAADGLPLTLGLGALNGLFYMTALVLNQYNISRNGVVLTSVFSRMGSLLVPLIASLVFFGEMPGAVQLVGAALAMLGIVLINSNGERSAVSAGSMLLLLLLAEGSASSMSKVFRELGDDALSGNFLLYTFGMAFLLSSLLSILCRERPGLRELAFGVMIGAPNFYASRFLLRALQDLPAVMIYPTRGVMSLMLITLAGVLIFGERLKKHQWIAMGVILLAVVLLNI